jgi:hypothetical protein
MTHVSEPALLSLQSSLPSLMSMVCGVSTRSTRLGFLISMLVSMTSATIRLLALRPSPLLISPGIPRLAFHLSLVRNNHPLAMSSTSRGTNYSTGGHLQP